MWEEEVEEEEEEERVNEMPIVNVRMQRMADDGRRNEWEQFMVGFCA